MHAENGVFVDNGGFEPVLALIAGLLILAMLGAGKFGADGIRSLHHCGASHPVTTA